MMQKKILINGAGRGCLDLMKTANEMGLYTIVTGMDGPCIPLASKAYRDVHPGHPEEVLRVAKEENVDGIVTCCNDMGLASVGYCCDYLNLTGLSFDSAKASSDKLLMKKKLLNHHVRTANFFIIKKIEQLYEAVSILDFPIVLKATDLQGSRGIYIIKEKTELEGAFNDVMALTKKDYCIVEEFIEGKEFGAQAFVYHGEILFVLPHGDYTLMCNTSVPIGHHVPYVIDDDLAKDVQIEARKAIMALGLDNCAVNIDFIENNGHAYVLELTGRGGANGLIDLVGLYYGINYSKMIIVSALGEDPREVLEKKEHPHKAVVSRMLFSDDSGIVKQCNLPHSFDGKIKWFVSPGDHVRKFSNSNDAIGEMIVIGNDVNDCFSHIEESLSRFEWVVETREINPDAQIINSKVGAYSRIFYKSFLRNSNVAENVVVRDFTRIEDSCLDYHSDIQRYSTLYNVTIGAYTYTGKNLTAWHAKIGKFCSISWNVSIGGANHDYKRIAQHAFLYSQQFGLLDGNNPLYDRFDDKCIIGNDVWIGCNVVINRNILIGNGAVVAAGSVVTHNVEPYTIVAGVPARVIGMRCNYGLASRLEKTEWWNLPDDAIRDNIRLFANKISEESVTKIELLCQQFLK